MGASGSLAAFVAPAGLTSGYSVCEPVASSAPAHVASAGGHFGVSNAPSRGGPDGAPPSTPAVTRPPDLPAPRVSAPLTRPGEEGGAPKQLIEAAPGRIGEMVRYSDGVSVQVANAGRATVEGEGPGGLTGLPKVQFTSCW